MEKLNLTLSELRYVKKYCNEYYNFKEVVKCLKFFHKWIFNLRELNFKIFLNEVCFLKENERWMIDEDSILIDDAECAYIMAVR